jgi:hypothetical protein
LGNSVGHVTRRILTGAKPAGDTAVIKKDFSSASEWLSIRGP